MHLAKGLEFCAVVVIACDDEIPTSQERIESVGDDADLQEVYDTERHFALRRVPRALDHRAGAHVNRIEVLARPESERDQARWPILRPGLRVLDPRSYTAPIQSKTSDSLKKSQRNDFLEQRKSCPLFSVYGNADCCRRDSAGQPGACAKWCTYVNLPRPRGIHPL